MLSCANDRDTASLKLSDVARQARAIIDYCVEGRDASYGGIFGVSDVPTFYVSVGGPVSDGASIDSINLLQGESTTIHGTELGGNTTFLDTE